METISILSLVFSALSVILLAVMLIFQMKKKNDKSQEQIEEELSDISSELELIKQQYDLQNRTLMDQVERVNNSVVKNIAMLGDNLRGSQETQQKAANEKLSKLESDFGKISENILNSLEQSCRSNSESIEKLRADNQQSLDKINATVNEKLSKLEGDFGKISENILNSLEQSRRSNSESIEKLRADNQQSLDKINATVNEKLSKLEGDFGKISENILNSLEQSRRSNSESIEKLRADNRQSLDKINETVNEKLQKTLNDRFTQSFSAVSKQLEQVHQGLGEMKTVASGVSDLKNVLSNVKTRGTLGEIQLGAILEQILAPEQFSSQQSVKPNSSEKVDFVIKLPGAEKNEFVYLPIDSKFPMDRFSDLLSAYESGNPEQIKAKKALLESEIKHEAKSIRDKYIVPPQTTNFAIMFLPSEGLYAEVINMGLVEVLQNSFQVNIAGPSTMAAMLNSLQMGFRTLAIQKKTGEVWKILGAAKKEFETFGKVFESARNNLRKADNDLEKLIGVRSRAINRSLRSVEQLDVSENSQDILKIEEESYFDSE